MANITWSYSSLSLYQQCPKKYYHLKVAKDIKEPLGEAIVFGNTIHKIAEEYVGKGIPIPEKYKEIEPALEAIRNMEGEKLCENKLGLTADLEPCGFFDKVYNDIPQAILTRNDLVIFCGWNNFRTLIGAFKANTGVMYNQVDLQGLADGDIVYPGTNVRVVAVPGLLGTNRIVCTYLGNLFKGVNDPKRLD